MNTPINVTLSQECISVLKALAKYNNKNYLELASELLENAIALNAICTRNSLNELNNALNAYQQRIV